MSMKRTPPPASWAEDINDWLESLKAAGLSDETVRCRRCKITKAARDLAKTPLEVTAEDMVHWMAAQKWKPESRKGYRNTLSSFYGWLYTTGRTGAPAYPPAPARHTNTSRPTTARNPPQRKSGRRTPRRTTGTAYTTRACFASRITLANSRLIRTMSPILKPPNAK